MYIHDIWITYIDHRYIVSEKKQIFELRLGFSPQGVTKRIFSTQMAEDPGGWKNIVAIVASPEMMRLMYVKQYVHQTHAKKTASNTVADIVLEKVQGIFSWYLGL